VKYKTVNLTVFFILGYNELKRYKGWRKGMILINKSKQYASADLWKLVELLGDGYQETGLKLYVLDKPYQIYTCIDILSSNFRHSVLKKNGLEDMFGFYFAATKSVYILMWKINEMISEYSQKFNDHFLNEKEVTLDKANAFKKMYASLMTSKNIYFVKYLFHELRHHWQLRNEPQAFIESQQVPYEERWIEKDAQQFSYEKLEEHKSAIKAIFNLGFDWAFDEEKNFSIKVN
jgi:hypothetical protein